MKAAAPGAQPNRHGSLEGSADGPSAIRDLRAFCLVVDLGSITAAARELGEAKGSVSRRLSRLEDEVGVALVHRTSRLVRATDEGLAFRAQTGRALELIDEASAGARGTAGQPEGHLRVTAPTDLALSTLGPIVSGFSRAYPAITVELVLTERMLDLGAERIDVALRATSKLEDSQLVAHPLLTTRGYLYAAPSYLAEHGTPKSPADLARHAHVCVGAVRGRKRLTLRKSPGHQVEVDVRAAVSAGDFSFCRVAAVSGAGIAVLPELAAAEDVASGALMGVLPGWLALSGRLYLVHHGRRLSSPKVRAFRDHVLAAFGARQRRPKL